MAFRSKKERLDRETDYLTFLPPMDEGFHTGYHTVPGIVCDQNRRPHEWLESLARNMHTSGSDVGFSIPDVLSGEQQLRRLARVPAHARNATQMTDYRAVLALLLLWDTWPKDDSWPVLELHCLRPETPFCQSVTAALTPERARDGLWVYALRAPHAPGEELYPIALITRAMAVTPAADCGDLSALLPPCVTWYDRVHKRFADPCLSLTERDGAYLCSRLHRLIALKEQPALHSPLAGADEALCSTLRRFADDISAARMPWRARFEQGDPMAERELLTRVLAAYTLTDAAAVPVRRETVDFAGEGENPLLHVYTADTAPACHELPLTLFTLDGVAFACPSAEYLLEPARDPRETETMARLQRELSLLEAHAPEWRAHAAETLRTLSHEARARAGLHPRVPQLLMQKAARLENVPAPAGRELELTYPLSDCPAALCTLLTDMLGPCDSTLIRNVFSDCLLLLDHPPVQDDASYPVEGEAQFAIAPLSPQLAAWLAEREEVDDLYAPKLDTQSLRFVRESSGIHASFRVLCRTKGEGTARTNAVTFHRTYALADRLQSGAAVHLTDAPYVAVWPNVRLTPGLWKQYFVYTHRPQALDIWALGDAGWVQGSLHENAGRSWQTACVSRFPAFVALKRGPLSLGVLINDLPRRLIRHELPADIAIDFGSIATTVMLGQGERIQPATLPECLHKPLLCLHSKDAQHLADEFLPEEVLLPAAPIEATYYSVMDMFTDRPECWAGVLTDGHIYYPRSFGELLQKSANALYYDLKWGEEDYARRCLKLFLKQAMMQAALSARLWGSPSAAWRVSMPNAMPPHRQEAYLEMMRGLAREVAAETGLPLTGGTPAVLYATENQADGLYFLSRSEINFQNGYLNLDIGGSTADLSLWLDGAHHAAIECSLLMGCRQMLFASLSAWHFDDLTRDFALGSPALKEAADRVAAALRTQCDTVQGSHKCMFMLDDLLAAYAVDIREAMAAARADGQIGYLESLLLFELGFLMYLSGDLLERAYQDAELRPLLPERMELCVAGNGGQLFKLLGEEQLTRLCSLALSRLSDGHPLRVLLPIQSRHPKQEVARGLLSDRGVLQSAIGGAERWNGTSAYEAGTHRANILLAYLPLFCRVFPQAAQRLMPRLFSATGAELNATAAMELDTIFANERPLTPQDDMAMYVRCFDKLKHLWRI